MRRNSHFHALHPLSAGNCIPFAVHAIVNHLRCKQILLVEDDEINHETCGNWILRSASSHMHGRDDFPCMMNTDWTSYEEPTSQLPLLAIHCAFAHHHCACILLIVHHSTACAPASALLLGDEKAIPPADAILVYDQARTHVSALLWPLSPTDDAHPAMALVAATCKTTTAAQIPHPPLDAPVWRLLAGGDAVTDGARAPAKMMQLDWSSIRMSLITF